MNRRLLELLCKASAPSLSPVTDNLSLWLDGRDGIFDTSYNRLETNAESNTFYLYDRASETYRLYQISAYGNLYGRYNGSGIIEYVKRNSSSQIGGLKMMGNMPNIRTIEITVGLDTSVMSTGATRCSLLTSGYNYGLGFAGSTTATIYAPSTFSNGGVASVPLSDANIHHYLVTIEDDLKWRLYKDGQLVSTSEYTFDIFTSASAISTFATAGSAPIGSVMARLASIRMWTDVLSTDEIVQDYAYERSTGRDT